MSRLGSQKLSVLREKTQKQQQEIFIEHYSFFFIKASLVNNYNK